MGVGREGTGGMAPSPKCAFVNVRISSTFSTCSRRAFSIRFLATHVQTTAQKNLPAFVPDHRLSRLFILETRPLPSNCKSSSIKRCKSWAPSNHRAAPSKRIGPDPTLTDKWPSSDWALCDVRIVAKITRADAGEACQGPGMSRGAWPRGEVCGWKSSSEPQLCRSPGGCTSHFCWGTAPPTSVGGPHLPLLWGGGGRNWENPSFCRTGKILSNKRKSRTQVFCFWKLSRKERVIYWGGSGTGRSFPVPIWIKCNDVPLSLGLYLSIRTSSQSAFAWTQRSKCDAECCTSLFN